MGCCPPDHPSLAPRTPSLHVGVCSTSTDLMVEIPGGVSGWARTIRLGSPRMGKDRFVPYGFTPS